jgi:DNA repair protein NreA
MRPEYDCLRCKGNNPRLYCGRDFCPIYKKLEVQKKVNLEAKKDFSGKSPNVFIGRFGYPDINVGILSAEEYTQHDNPLFWSSHDYKINDIVNLRTELINSSFKANIKSFKTKFLDMSQEISMAVKPVDVEVSLNKKPQFKLTFNQDVIPHGPNVRLEKAEITENPKIPHVVDEIVDSFDLKANEALNTLYKKGYDEHYLTKLLSVGNLGVKKERKLVPTRWSITAVDDNVGKTIIKEIKDYQNYNYVAHFGSYFGNYYLILFFPEVWSYELFETYLPDALWNQKKKIQIMTDYETYGGRKDYASNTVGGYYAARLSILEYLKSKKRQGSVLALRFVTDEYWAPLGVWVVRETVRKSLQSQVIEFSSKELMLDYAKKLIKKKFGYDVSEILHESILLKEMKQQKKLSEYS